MTPIILGASAICGSFRMRGLPHLFYFLNGFLARNRNLLARNNKPFESAVV
jgi:hypothetical protein